jgi:hypothetical protein
MSCVDLKFNSIEGLTLDGLIAKVLAHWPGASITSEDWYAERRLEEQKVIELIRSRGEPFPENLERLILSDVERAEAEWGPARTIRIPMTEGSSLEGRICLKFALLHSEDLLDEAATERLVALFKSLGVLADFSAYSERRYYPHLRR